MQQKSWSGPPLARAAEAAIKHGFGSEYSIVVKIYDELYGTLLEIRQALIYVTSKGLFSCLQVDLQGALYGFSEEDLGFGYNTK